MNRRRVVDGSVGETRWVDLLDDAPIAIGVRRWSEAGRRAWLGQVLEGRIVALDRRLGGAFVDLGLSEDQGFLSTARVRTPLTEGARLTVRVVREAVRGKAAVLARASSDDRSPQGVDDPTFRPPPAAASDAEIVDAAIEAALAREAPVPGGGRLVIEPTAALVAIDVDAGARAGGSDRERFNRDLNVSAVTEAMRQVRLRSLGGLCAIDCVSMRDPADRKAVEAAARRALAADGAGAVAAPLSRFGVLEFSRPGTRRPLHETLLDQRCDPTSETQALTALRSIERAAATARGRLVRARLSGAALKWLDAQPFDWRGALNARIGVRWSLQPAEGLLRHGYALDLE